MIHVDLFQNCIERHFLSTLEHHAKAFGTIFSVLFLFILTECHNVSHNPFLALYQGKNEKEKSDMFGVVIPLCAFHKDTKLLLVSGRSFSQ